MLSDIMENTLKMIEEIEILSRKIKFLHKSQMESPKQKTSISEQKKCIGWIQQQNGDDRKKSW